MKFADDYFKGEEREGFFVEEMMKRAWAAQIEVLKEIERVCKKHGIRYFADWGTLLGAVRHKGFIPWDDDIDITMFREDYEKFLKVAQQELPTGYKVFNVYTHENYEEVFTRINNGAEINLTDEYLEKYHGCPYVVGIDVFPQDYLPPSIEEKTALIHMMKVVMLTKELVRNNAPDVEEGLQKVEEICGVYINREQPIHKQLLILIDRISQMFPPNECNEIAVMYHWCNWQTEIENGTMK